MRVAIASNGKDLASEVSAMGGRAPFYLIFDDGKLVEVVENPFARGGGGAGFAVPQMLADKGVELIVAGRFGENMRAVMHELGIKAIEASGKISEVLEKL